MAPTIRWFCSSRLLIFFSFSKSLMAQTRAKEEVGMKEIVDIVRRDSGDSRWLTHSKRKGEIMLA